MAQAQARAQIPLLATVALLLDEDAEAIGSQFLRLSAGLDPLVRSRAQLLRVRGDGNRLTAETLTEESRVLVPTTASGRLAQSTPLAPITPPQDPNDTQAINAPSSPNIRLGTPQAFDVALRNTVQDVLKSAGTEHLSERGFALFPNELAVYIISRMDNPLLATVADVTQQLTQSISLHTDARRFGVLLATPGMHSPVAPSAREQSDWQERAARQPWRKMLSWEGGEPPLLYAFVFEHWDEASRYLDSAHLHYATAEALYSLFATGILEHPRFKDALDLSTATFDASGGLSHVGSIGTSLITSPTHGMVDYLAYRLAADVLLRRGLLGNDGGLPVPQTHPTIQARGHHEAERWMNSTFRARLDPNRYALPRNIPPREIETNVRDSWAPMSLSTASPDPGGLFFRWDAQRFPLDDEAFWNLAIQNEYDTVADARQWDEKTEAVYRTLAVDLSNQMSAAIKERALEPEGIERAKEFIEALRKTLSDEQTRLNGDRVEQTRQLDLHHRNLEEKLRRTHRARGIPHRQNPPENKEVPTLPRNMEALSHEVLDESFARVPMPLTLVIVAFVVTALGALIAIPFAHSPLATQLPGVARNAITGPSSTLVGALSLLAIFVVVAITPVLSGIDLRRWQRRYAGERLLLRLARAKDLERQGMLAVTQTLLSKLGDENGKVLGWESEITMVANRLSQTGTALGEQYASHATITRDVFVARGMVWDAIDPHQLYAQVRASQDEQALVMGFLRYVQSYEGDVTIALQRQHLDGLALEFMREQLLRNTEDQPFAQWDAATASLALEHAVQSARVPIQPKLVSHPLSHFDSLAAHPSVAWLARDAESRDMQVILSPSPQWCMVTRIIARARHMVVR